MEEHWKDIKRYEGKYQVSDWGNVRSLNYNGHSGLIRLLKPSLRPNGYLSVQLYKDKKPKSEYVHRLVAEAFIPNPYNYPQINHKDENKRNNFVTNLEYCTSQYNLNYGTHNQKIADAKSIAVDQFDKNGCFVKRFKSIREASRKTRVNASHITQCAKGYEKTCGGYIWRYATD